MTRLHQILFVGAFLFIIYAIPGWQSAYEYFFHKDANGKPAHSIQVFELLEDLFVTPAKKANADADTLASLISGIDALGATLAKEGAAAAEAIVDASIFRVKQLKRGVVEYNRYIKDENNPYLTHDSIKPYYRTLRKLHNSLESLRSIIEAEESVAAVLPMVDSLKASAAALQPMKSRTTLLTYPALVGTALRRIAVGDAYLRPYEKTIEKSSVFADAIRPKMQLAYFIGFGDLGDKAVQGKNSWFFYRPDVDFLVKPYVRDVRSQIVDPNDAPIRDSIIDTILAFKQQLDERGIGLLIVIMPGKPSIYPEVLHQGMKPEVAGTFSHSLRLMAELRSKGVDVVDLFGPFAAERRNDAAAGDSLYLRTDTHFKTRAVNLTAKVVADRVKQYPWFQPGAIEYAIDTVSVLRYGDVAEMTKLPSIRLRDLKLSFEPEHTTCYQVSRIIRDEDGIETSRSLYKDDYRRSQILILGDSFSRIYQTDPPRSAGWVANLAYELSQPVALIYNDGGASTIVREVLSRRLNNLDNKKLVIWEFVERDIRFGEKGWKHIKFAAGQDAAAAE